MLNYPNQWASNNQDLYLNPTSIPVRSMGPYDPSLSHLQRSGSQVDDYPFGKESIRIAKYVTKQMNNKEEQENKKILQKFRMDAIKFRNQRVMKHHGRLPYISESMLAGTNIDASQFMQQSPQRQPIFNPSIQVSRPQPIPPPYQPKTPLQYPRIIEPRTKPNKKSVGIGADFQAEFPLYKKKRHHSKKYYTIENYEQELAFDRIGKMLHQINQKLSHNTRTLENSRIVPENQQKQILSPRKKKIKQKFWTEHNEELSPPKIEYTGVLRRNNTITHKKSQNVQQHLAMLNKKRKRLDQLNEKIISLQNDE